MIWTSWQDFLAMNGYGWYVWGSMAGVAGLMGAEVVSLRLRAKSIARRHALAGQAEFTGMTDED